MRRAAVRDLARRNKEELTRCHPAPSSQVAIPPFGPKQLAAPSRRTAYTDQSVLRFSLLLATTCCMAQPVRGPIVAIDFYGAAPVDYTRLRAAFPFQIGATFELKGAAVDDDPDPRQPELKQLLGTNRISVAPVFVPDLKGWVFYVDVEPPHASAPAIVSRPPPSGTSRLPPGILAVYEHSIRRFADGGIHAGDETTHGYSISKDPIMRADQLQLIDYARAHPKHLYSVLERSGATRDRIAAAWIAGYAPRGSKQLNALLHAANDPDSTVRNNAIRVLAVEALHDARIARQIPAEPFIPMLHSLTWSDRNKAMWLLDPVTAARDPRTIESLRRQTIEPLRQMSRWTYWFHASMALVLLGRIAGIPEPRLQSLLEARDAATILAEASHIRPE